MPDQTVTNEAVFSGLGSDGRYGLWISDGTASGTLALAIADSAATGLNPTNFVSLGGAVLFTGTDAANATALYVTNGTAGGTVEVSIPGASDLAPSTILGGNRVLLTGTDSVTHANKLWVLNGATGSAVAVSLQNATVDGLGSPGFVPLGNGNGDAVFVGTDHDGNTGLWRLNGATGAATELSHAVMAGTAITLIGQTAVFMDTDGDLNAVGSNGVQALPLPAGTIDPALIAVLGGRAVFADPDGGLWTTNGTTAGTTKLTTIAAARLGTFVTTGAGQALFEDADNALWTTDGTAAGTHQLTQFAVMDGSVASLGSGKALFEDANGGVYVTDGTTGGTGLVSTASISGTVLFARDGKALFASTAGTLWYTDGTQSGTHEVSSQVMPDPATVTSLKDGEILFQGDDGAIWVTDGSAHGAAHLTLQPGLSGATLLGGSGGGVLGNALFSALDALGRTELWATDGTVSGTYRVSGGTQPASVGIGYPGGVALANGLLFNGSDADGAGLWTTDGSVAGTTKVAAVGAQTLVQAGGKALFADGNNALWISDGTAAGTVELSDAVVPDNLPALTALGNGKVLFAGTDAGGDSLWSVDVAANTATALQEGSTPNSITALGNGRAVFEDGNGEVWSTNGTAVTDLHLQTGPGTPIAALGGGKAVLSAVDAVSGTNALWATDGVTVTELGVNADPANPPAVQNPGLITSLGNGKAVFAGTDSVNGANGLWATNGTTVTELLAAAGPANPPALHDVNALAAMGGNEALAVDGNGALWITDGSSASTQMLSGPATPDLTTVTALGGHAAVLADTGGELWGVDGTAHTAADLHVHLTPGGTVTSLGNGQAVFNGTDGGGHTQLWVTDGTAAHTHALAGTNASTTAFAPAGITLLGNKAVLAGTAVGQEGVAASLWVTDGTGLTQIAAPNGLAAGLNPYNFAVRGDRAYFAGADYAGQGALWVTDGTTAGTTELTSSDYQGVLTGSAGLVAAQLHPLATGLTVTPDRAGPLKAGDNVLFTLSAGTPLTVTGQPSLRLGNGASAAFQGVSPGGDLLFRYDVQAGGDTADLTVSGLVLNGASIKAATQFSLDASTLPGLAGADTHLVVDTTAPVTPMSLALATGPDAATPRVTGLAEAGSTVRLYGDGTLLGSVVASPNGAWQITASGALAAGSHGLTATATDVAGNVSALSAPLAFSVAGPVTTTPVTPDPTPTNSAPTNPAPTDPTPTQTPTQTPTETPTQNPTGTPTQTPTTLPVTVALSRDTGTSVVDGITNDASLAGTAAANSTVTVSESGKTLASTTAGTDGRWQVAGRALGLADGVHTLAVTDTDGAGNSGTAAITLSLDTTLPKVALASASAVVNTTTPTLTGTAEAGARVNVSLDSVSLGTVTADANGAWSEKVTSTLSAGTHRVSAVATDAAGNASAAATGSLVVLPASVAGGGTAANAPTTFYHQVVGQGAALQFAPGTQSVTFSDGTLSLGTDTPQAHLARLYATMFGGNGGGDTQGLAYWNGRLNAGATSLQIAQGFLDSPAGQASTAHLSDDQFVSMVYHGALGRAASGAETAYWTQTLATGGSRAGMLDSVTDVPESKQALVSSTAQVWVPDQNAQLVVFTFETAFGRAPDDGGFNYWAAKLDSGMSFSDFETAFVSGAEFQAVHGNQTTAQLVTSLYQQGLGRDPSAAELGAYTGSKASAASVLGTVSGSLEAALHLQNKL